MFECCYMHMHTPVGDSTTVVVTLPYLKCLGTCRSAFQTSMHAAGNSPYFNHGSVGLIPSLLK